jgi:hypothetical protein
MTKKQKKTIKSPFPLCGISFLYLLRIKDKRVVKSRDYINLFKIKCEK